MSQDRAPSAAPRASLAAALFALLAALLVGPALVNPGQIVLSVDTASVHLPWSAALADRLDPEVTRPRNGELSDHGVSFYPFYRWALESWRAGDPPLWCPLIYLGAPALGNPQMGVLDPQVLALWPLEALFGLDGFHLGLAWFGWARLFAAGLGAFLLARRLGLGAGPALLAGVVFQVSGFVQLWLHFSLGHVAPLLPWLLLGIEACRGPRPARAAAAIAALVLLIVLGGHPETSFYVGVAGGLWALGLLARDRRAGALALGAMFAGSLLALPAVLPFLEYLSRSAAQAIRERLVLANPVDPVVLGVTLAGAAALVIAARPLGDRGQPGARGVRFAALGSVALLGGMLAWLARQAGLPETAVLAFLPDLFGHPGRGGYQGQGIYAEEASAWLPSAALALALAAPFAARGPLVGRRLALGIGLVALLLVLRSPGLLELKQRLPVVGLGATVRLAPVSALFLALVAADALAAAGPWARRAGVALCAGLALVLALPAGGSALAPGVDRGPEQGDLLGFVLVPRVEGGAVEGAFEAWLAPGLPASGLRLEIRPAGPDGAAVGPPVARVSADPRPGPSERARLRAPEAVAAAPPGALWFDSRVLQVGRLEAGLWRLDAFPLGTSGEVLGQRRAAILQVERRPRPGGVTVVLALLALGLLVGGGRGAGALPNGVLLLIVART